jgi:phosphatidylglycerophosphatase C
VKKKIAFFDFDGTITTKDSLLGFIRYSKGSFHYYTGFLLHAHYLLAYKLKIISNQKAKEKVLAYFFRNTPLEQFNQKCVDYINNIVPSTIRPKALQEIKTLQDAGTRVVIVSASSENWIEPWARKIQAETLATRMEVIDNRITGLLIGKNCHGEEKVRRIREKFNLTEFDEISAYGDTSGDKPMLALAHHPHYKPFRF